MTTYVSVADDTPRTPDLDEAVDYETALAASSPERGFGPRSADDRYIVYTGGTTGMPKGTIWRHEDIFLGALAEEIGRTNVGKADYTWATAVAAQAT